jgi:6-pyruvoyltetrahydropterin/6-carboxytetrahydropterin synthase
MSGAFEVGTSVRIRAIHRLPWGEGPEREPHAHEYRIEVIVERERLDGRGVVIDLDVLEAELEALTAQLQGQDLDAVVVTPEADGVTVEILARWVHGRLADAIARAGADALCVRVWESADAFGGYRAAVGGDGPAGTSSA